MPVPWRTVRIFISSTFRDMHAERDHLVRYVFPRLRETLALRRIHLVDVDLRWGVTGEQDALEVCREVIDECRPRFVCMLGGRYGCTPEGGEHSITEAEIHHGVLDSLGRHGYAYFYFRDPAATETMAESTSGDYREPPGSPEARKLVLLKQRVQDAGLHPYIYPARWSADLGRLAGLEAFGQHVHDDLLASIDDEFGAQPAEALDEFAAERQAMEAFVEERLERFVLGSRADAVGRVLAVARRAGEASLALVTGAPGSGKTALLGHVCRRIERDAGDCLLLPHFIGASIGSTRLRSLLRRLCHELWRAAGGEEPTAADTQELADHFARLLQEVSERRPVVLVLDALDQLDPSDNAHALAWLPRPLPPRVRVVASSLDHPALQALRRRGDTIEEVPLAPLSDTDSRDIITRFLARYHKHMTEEQMASLLAKPDAGNPLYLTSALTELRTLGTYEEMTARIHGLPGRVVPLFDWVLARLEQDPGFRDPQGRPVGASLVRGAAALLSASRHGLAHEELAALAAPAASPAGGADPQGNVSALERFLRPYLMRRGDLLDFYHGQFRAAVQARYLATDESRLAVHRRLADYFLGQANRAGDGTWAVESRRGLAEAPFHLTASRDGQRLADVLCDLKFIEAKCAAGMAYELVADYQRALPEDGGAAVPLPDAVAEFGEFVRRQAPLLAAHPGVVPQQASNQPDRGAVARAARALRETGRERRPWLAWLNKPEDHDPLLHTFDTLLTAPAPCDVSPDSRHIVGSPDGTGLRLWDAASGAEVLAIQPQDERFAACRFTPAGTHLLSLNSRGDLTFWELPSGTRTLTLRASVVNPPRAFALSPDGSLLVCCHRDGTFSLWQAASGTQLGQRPAHAATHVAWAPDGRRFATSGEDGTLRVWSAESGDRLALLTGHDSAVSACAWSPDGKRLLSSSWDGLAVLWDVEARVHQLLLRGHDTHVCACAWSPDGARALTGDNHGNVRVWDTHTGEPLGMRHAHSHIVNACFWAPDQRRILTAGNDWCVRVWDARGFMAEGADAAALHKSPVTFSTLSAVARRTLTSGSDADLMTWDLDTGAGRAHDAPELKWVSRAAYAPDGRSLLTLAGDNTLALWDADLRECTTRLEPMPIPSDPRDAGFQRVTAWSWSPGVPRVAAGSTCGHVAFWRVADGALLSCAAGHAGNVATCAWSPGGRRLVTAGADGKLIVWDGSGGRRLRSVDTHAAGARDVAWSPDARLLLSASDDGTLLVSDAATGATLHTLLQGSTAVVSCAWSADGQSVFAAMGDGEVRRWGVRDGTSTVTARTYSLYFRDRVRLFPSADGRRLHALHRHGLEATNLETGETELFFPSPAEPTTFAVDPCGRTVLIGTISGQVFVLQAEGVAMGVPVTTAACADGHQAEATCPVCGRRSPVDDALLSRIGATHDLLHVPPEAFTRDDLLMPCRHCGEAVRLNPFLARDPVAGGDAPHP